MEVGNKVKIAVIGLGSRGENYIRWLRLFRRKAAEVVAVCDLNPVKAAKVGKQLKLGEKAIFTDEKEFFKVKRADAVWICTQDADHYRNCMQAIALGYDVMVEKPVSYNLDECLEIKRAAEEKGVKVVVCHVLRYSYYYSKIKDILRSGELGEIMTFNHQENIAYYHFAHSYVRGNWRDKAKSTPVLMAKCCHDIDLISWFMEGEAEDVKSYGALTYFRPENAPEGAPNKCTDGCPHAATCPYNAVKLYITDPFWKAKFIKYMPSVLTGKYRNSKADILAALKTGSYGNCVFRSDNTTNDHQVVMMKFKGERYATHTLSAFTSDFFRNTRITCTKGQIVGDDASGKLKVSLFGGKTKTYRTKKLPLPGHLEGDIKLVKTFIDLMQGKADTKDITFIDATIASHRTIVRAEESYNSASAD